MSKLYWIVGVNGCRRSIQCNSVRARCPCPKTAEAPPVLQVLCAWCRFKSALGDLWLELITTCLVWIVAHQMLPCPDAALHMVSFARYHLHLHTGCIWIVAHQMLSCPGGAAGEGEAASVGAALMSWVSFARLHLPKLAKRLLVLAL